ncbi:MAG: hypothetical protein ACK481_02975 [Candidatus Melainabacteria bacterium]|jgi:hypothetical protein
MKQFIDSIRKSVKDENWLAALFMALAMPDICSSLEFPNRPRSRIGEYYGNWFNKFLKPKYASDNAYDHLMATDPEFLNGIEKLLPPEFNNMFVEQHRLAKIPSQTKFTAEDCYRFRCRCLHEGLAQRSKEGNGNPIIFTVPKHEKVGFHKSSINGVLQLQIDTFCEDVCLAVLEWEKSVINNNEIKDRMEELITTYILGDQILTIS